MAADETRDDKKLRDAVHDLNNLLASIVGYADFLQEDLLLGSAQHKFAESIHRGGTEAQAIVASLLSDSPKKASSSANKGPVEGPVLVVEDQKDVREMMMIMLERMSIPAQSCSDGLAAIQILRENPGEFGLVIADHAMPGMNGSDLALMIETDFPGLPVILMSGRGEYDLQALHERTPSIRAVLQKPVDFKRLVELIRSID